MTISPFPPLSADGGPIDEDEEGCGGRGCLSDFLGSIILVVFEPVGEDTGRRVASSNGGEESE